MSRVERHRLAVLPFENLTRNAADDWLSGGLSDSLTYGLQNLDSLILTTRERTAEVYRQRQVHEAAPLDPGSLRTLVQELGVQSYVHGTYQRVGDDIRVVARLVSIDSGEVTAQESVTDRFANILKLEDELASRFAAKLDASGRAARPAAGTASVDAYRAYSEAQALYDSVSDRKTTRQHLREAIRIDPRYAQAWALLSKAHSRTTAAGERSGVPLMTKTAAKRGARRNARSSSIHSSTMRTWRLPSPIDEDSGSRSGGLKRRRRLR